MFNHLMELKPSEGRRKHVGPDISIILVEIKPLEFKPFTIIHVAFYDPCRNRQQQASEGSVDGGSVDGGIYWRLVSWELTVCCVL